MAKVITVFKGYDGLEHIMVSEMPRGVSEEDVKLLEAQRTEVTHVGVLPDQYVAKLECPACKAVERY